MAEHALIDRYLRELRTQLPRSAEADDIVAEVADHLQESVFRRRDRGLALPAAERAVLAEFGDPILVGRAFASSKHGGIAVPTIFTRRAGLVGIISAALYIGATLAKVVDNATNETGDWNALWWNVSLILFPAAGVLLVALVVGLNRRHGGALGRQGQTATYVLGASAVTSLPGPFLWGPWLTLLLLGSVLLVTRLNENGLVPVWARNAMIAGSALTATAMWIPWVLPDVSQSFGDDPTIWFVSAGFLIFAAGIYGISRWLYLETPVDEPENLLAV